MTLVVCPVCGEKHEPVEVFGIQMIPCPKVPEHLIIQTERVPEVVSDPCPPEPAPSASTPPKT
jgi:hypothetical protein